MISHSYYANASVRQLVGENESGRANAVGSCRKQRALAHNYETKLKRHAVHTQRELVKTQIAL